MKKIFLLIVLIVLAFSCTNDNTSANLSPVTGNKVLVLKVDYTTNVFEGGKEFTFASNTATFTIRNQYAPPGDFGNLKLFYNELNEPLFDGDIIWMGLGTIHFPTDIHPQTWFNTINTIAPVPMPAAGFENVFNPNNQTYNYTPVWTSIQYLEKVNQYIATNPNATIKIFLYTPSVGMGNPADWKWIIFMKSTPNY